MRVGILGPGAIGGFLAALCCRNGHQVICIGKNRAIERIKSEGISLESKLYGNFLSKPSASESLEEKVDILFLCVKSSGIEGALKRVSNSRNQDTVVVSLLNGVGHRQIVRETFGRNLVMGSIGSIEATIRLNNVNHLSKNKPRIDIASNSVLPMNELNNTSNFISSLGIESDTLQNEEEVIWNKLVRLNAISSLTAAYQKPLGELIANKKIYILMKRMVLESIEVAKKEGVTIDHNNVLDQIKVLPPTLETSLQRDIKAGKKSELDSIIGGVISLAQKYEISVSTHQLVYKLITKQLSKL